MTNSTHLLGKEPPRAGLWSCRRAATVVEFALAAALLATAVTAVRSPRFQTIKDEPCSAKHARCLPAGSAQR